MTWDISYKHGDKSGFRSVRSRGDALTFCGDMVLHGHEILSVVNGDKKSTETVSLSQVEGYVARIRARR